MKWFCNAMKWLAEFSSKCGFILFIYVYLDEYVFKGALSRYVDDFLDSISNYFVKGVK